MDWNIYKKIIFERGITFEKRNDEWCCLTSETNYMPDDFSNIIGLTGYRPILVTYEAGESFADLTIPHNIGRLLDIYRSELCQQIPVNINYLMGACLYQFKELVKWNSKYCVNYSNSIKPKQTIVVSSPEVPHYLFESLVTEIVRSFNSLRYPMWNKWGSKSGVPNSFERTINGFATVPEDMKVYLEERNKTLVRLKNYRDCIQHYVGVGSSSWVQLEKSESGIWSVITKIPDNPECRSSKSFLFKSGLDAVSMVWKFITEFFQTVAVVFNRKDLIYG